MTLDSIRNSCDVLLFCVVLWCGVLCSVALCCVVLSVLLIFENEGTAEAMISSPHLLIALLLLPSHQTNSNVVVVCQKLIFFFANSSVLDWSLSRCCLWLQTHYNITSISIMKDDNVLTSCIPVGVTAITLRRQWRRHKGSGEDNINR